MKSLILVVLFAFFSTKSNAQIPQKSYKVTISKTVQEWQLIISVLSHSPNLSAQLGTTTSEEIALSLNTQLTQETLNQPKQDSANNAIHSQNKPIPDSLKPKHPKPSK